MGSLKTFALAGAVALAAGATANAADFGVPPPPPPAFEPVALRGSISSGVYLRGDIGVGSTNYGKYEQDGVRAAGGRFIRKEDQSTNFFGGVGIGYRFNNWFRVDGTFEYRGGGTIGATDQLNFTTITPVGQINSDLRNTYKGNMTSMVALFNAYVDLGTWNCLTPYLGAGIGVASHRVSGVTDQGVIQNTFFPAGGGAPQFGTSATLGTAGNGTRSSVAWALMAGVGYEVNKNLTLEVGYRYLNMGRAQSGAIIDAFNGQNYGPLKVKNIDSHDIRIGMRWNFNDPNCCGPKEPPPMAYAPAPVVRKY